MTLYRLLRMLAVTLNLLWIGTFLSLYADADGFGRLWAKGEASQWPGLFTVLIIPAILAMFFTTPVLSIVLMFWRPDRARK